MSTYAIGDVHGCFHTLLALLNKINFDPIKDTLWFVGDLVNRGPSSLETINFIMALPETTICVLGNHDISLMVTHAGYRNLRPHDTFNDILTAPNCKNIISWLRKLPLIHTDHQLGFTLTHAGVYPAWSLSEANQLAKEVQDLLQGKTYNEFMMHLFGNTPESFSENLNQWEKARFIINAFTRMRYCTPTGDLDFKYRGSPSMAPTSVIPWFKYPNSAIKHDNIIFGHWASLLGKSDAANVFAIDTGCVWGNALTAFCLETKTRISIPCQDHISLSK